MPRKKLWYVPGLYSLLGLPILLLLMGPEDVQEKVALRLFLADDRRHHDDKVRFTSAMVLEKASKLKPTTVDFWYKGSDDLSTYRHISKFEIIEREMQLLANVHDTTRCLKIEMGEGISYGEFVSILNAAIINNIRRYAIVGSTMYIFPNEIPTDPGLYEPLEIYVDNSNAVEYKEPSWWETFKTDFKYEWNQQLIIWSYYLEHNYVLISGFLLLIVLPFILRFRKFRRVLPSRQYPLQS